MTTDKSSRLRVFAASVITAGVFAAFVAGVFAAFTAGVFATFTAGVFAAGVFAALWPVSSRPPSLRPAADASATNVYDGVSVTKVCICQQWSGRPQQQQQARDSGRTIIFYSCLYLVTFWFLLCSPGSPAAQHIHRASTTPAVASTRHAVWPWQRPPPPPTAATHSAHCRPPPHSWTIPNMGKGGDATPLASNYLSLPYSQKSGFFKKYSEQIKKSLFFYFFAILLK